jgi:ribA/ribD-fused uncharacterized protein
MRETNTHIYFWGSYLSNWIPADLSIKFSGHTFTNSEQLFMYLKAVSFHDEETADRIVKEGTYPKAAKELGRQVKNYDEKQWATLRENAMYTAVSAKFASNRELQEKLLDTGNKILVEGTPMDPVWGVMVHWKDDRILDERNWKGKNLLGKVLMRVRQDLKNTIVNG